MVTTQLETLLQEINGSSPNSSTAAGAVGSTTVGQLLNTTA